MPGNSVSIETKGWPSMASEMMSNSDSRFTAHTERTTIGFSRPGSDDFGGLGNEFVGGSDGHAFGSRGDGSDGVGGRGDDFGVGGSFSGVGRGGSSGEGMGGFWRNRGRWELWNFWVRV